MSETVRLVSGIQHPGSAGGIYETAQHFSDIKEHLHVVKRDLESLAQRNAVSAAPAPTHTHTLSHESSSGGGHVQLYSAENALT